MSRVVPDVEPQRADPWTHDTGEHAASGAGGGWSFERTPSEDERPATPPPVQPGPGSGGGGRFFRHERQRPQGGDLNRVDIRNTWQVVAGSVLVPLGVVFILIAWYGAAHTPYVQQQIPYLVSGSFAGVGCMVLGGLLYWAHWLYRMYDQADQHHEQQMQLMQQTLRALTDRLGAQCGDGYVSQDASGPGSPAGPAMAPENVLGSYPYAGAGDGTPGSDSGEAPLGVTGSYVVTAAGSVYHHPGCPIIAHHTEGLRVLGAGAVVGMDPCRICLPTSNSRPDTGVT